MILRFSGVAVLIPRCLRRGSSLLAQAGVRKIRSLGVDGGAGYSQDFGDLKDKTLLVNGRKSFDDQFEEIAKIIMTTGIDYAPLDVGSPIRVYVGATEAQMLPVKVLEYSIRKHASMSVEVFPLHLSGVEIPTPRDPKKPSSHAVFLPTFFDSCPFRLSGQGYLSRFGHASL